MDGCYVFGIDGEIGRDLAFEGSGRAFLADGYFGVDFYIFFVQFILYFVMLLLFSYLLRRRWRDPKCDSCAGQGFQLCVVVAFGESEMYFIFIGVVCLVGEEEVAGGGLQSGWEVDDEPVDCLCGEEHVVGVHPAVFLQQLLYCLSNNKSIQQNRSQDHNFKGFTFTIWRSLAPTTRMLRAQRNFFSPSTPSATARVRQLGKWLSIVRSSSKGSEGQQLSGWRTSFSAWKAKISHSWGLPQWSQSAQTAKYLRRAGVGRRRERMQLRRRQRAWLFWKRGRARMARMQILLLQYGGRGRGSGPCASHSQAGLLPSSSSTESRATMVALICTTRVRVFDFSMRREQSSSSFGGVCLREAKAARMISMRQAICHMFSSLGYTFWSQAWARGRRSLATASQVWVSGCCLFCGRRLAWGVASRREKSSRHLLRTKWLRVTTCTPSCRNSMATRAVRPVFSTSQWDTATSTTHSSASWCSEVRRCRQSGDRQPASASSSKSQSCSSDCRRQSGYFSRSLQMRLPILLAAKTLTFYRYLSSQRTSFSRRRSFTQRSSSGREMIVLQRRGVRVSLSRRTRVETEATQLRMRSSFLSQKWITVYNARNTLCAMAGWAEQRAMKGSRQLGAEKKETRVKYLQITIFGKKDNACSFWANSGSTASRWLRMALLNQFLLVSRSEIEASTRMLVSVMLQASFGQSQRKVRMGIQARRHSGRGGVSGRRAVRARLSRSRRGRRARLVMKVRLPSTYMARLQSRLPARDLTVSASCVLQKSSAISAKYSGSCSIASRSALPEATSSKSLRTSVCVTEKNCWAQSGWLVERSMRSSRVETACWVQSWREEARREVMVERAATRKGWLMRQRQFYAYSYSSQAFRWLTDSCAQRSFPDTEALMMPDRSDYTSWLRLRQSEGSTYGSSHSSSSTLSTISRISCTTLTCTSTHAHNAGSNSLLPMAACNSSMPLPLTFYGSLVMFLAQQSCLRQHTSPPMHISLLSEGAAMARTSSRAILSAR